MPRVVEEQTVLSTKWFDLIARTIEPSNSSEPYYSLRVNDYVSIVAVTGDREIVLVRQYRPAVGKVTLELPSGMVEPNEPPEQTARRELLEETGWRANDIELLGALDPDTGRLSNRLWCFLATDVEWNDAAAANRELETITCSLGELSAHIEDGRLDHALHLAALHLAVVKGKLPLHSAH